MPQTAASGVNFARYRYKLTACWMLQLAWANELLEVHLQEACEQLHGLSTAAGADGNGQDLKLQLDALVKQVTACFVGAQSCIPEPASPATSRPTCGTPLTTHAQVLLAASLLPSELCHMLQHP